MDIELKFLTVGVGLLRPNPWNTNTVGAANFEKLKTSIDRLGFFKPVLVREVAGGFYEILGGEHRWRAAVEQGRETIAINSVGKIDDVLAKQMSLVDNERYGEDDDLALQRLIEELQTSLDYNFSEIIPIDDELLATVSRESAADFEKLEELLAESGEEELPKDPREKKERLGVDHQTMRFKVSYDVAESVTTIINRIIAEQEINTGNESEDAGEALVWLCDHYKDVTDEK
ncbi:ParB/RepB/Spo0J family partition protein [Klebsiella sp. 10982]|uniref:ParB/RepB/Spo0J family partition protein n=1 Tax=Klebsiella sp. 10982 TaxID=1196034 RepID=UPI000B411EEE|nr:chromosome partitioning protein ParB [Klebsiella sp. PO552]HBR4177505.1 ParB/RepB/Spo0J family partition protein [Klebsiella pneumoniae]HBU7613600.1 ParB/RepB/Spo0J family partition protein [Klebsiella pneumoniae]HBV2056106.1 ParB/RepB/Spo0J family partition protein [Klebsiella pneumoniae]HBV4871625.1 ParB/RepB/Spo0J family partition protein [Klebsiella pneumoniae]